MMDRNTQVVSRQQRVDELEQALSACNDVNRHLAAEVERLSLENDSLQQHIHRLRKRLKPSPTSKEDDDTVPPESLDGGAAAAIHDFNMRDDDDSDDMVLQDSLDIVGLKDYGKLKAAGRAQGWLVDPSQVTLGHVIGEGSFGSTYKGIWRGADCAVKIVKPSGESAENFARELTTLALIRHFNVVALYGAVIQSPPEKSWLVCEWLSGGTLSAWLHNTKRSAPPRSLIQRLHMALDIACGMEALEQHDPPILHRDLKPTNIILDACGRAKVADFGLSRVLTPETMLELTPETGSYLYMAPEVVRHEVYATQADVWSWACCVSELLTGMKPYTERLLTPVQVALKVADGKLRPAIPATCPPGLAELLVSALDIDPLRRPSFAVTADVMRRVVEEEERREAAASGSGGGLGLTAAWNRWMMGSEKTSPKADE